MKRFGGGFFAPIFVSFLVAGLFIVNQVIGAVDDIWLTKPITSTKVASNIGDIAAHNSPDCNNTEQPAYAIRNGQPTAGGVKVPACWMRTANGSIEAVSGGVKYMRIGSVGSVAQNDSFYGSYRLAGAKVVVGYTDRSVQIFDQPDISGSIKMYNSNVYFVLDKPDGTRWKIAYPNTSERLQFYYYNVSNSGEWLVGRTPYGFTRVNLNTKEVLNFATPTSRGYGYQADPHYTMAISDDGRHVAWLEGDKYGYDTRMYDLATCAVSSTQYHETAAGCLYRDIKNNMLEDGMLGEPGNFYFNTAGNVLTFVDLANQVWNRRAIVGGIENRYDYIALGDSYSSGEGAFNGALTYRHGTDRDGALYPESYTGLSGYPYEKEVCHQSTTSYPYLLVGARAVSDFGDVACSGAKLNDIINDNDNSDSNTYYEGHFSQFLDDIAKYSSVIKANAVNDLFPGRASQIEMLQKHQPQVVTIGIGGNDIGFKDKLQSCVASPTETCSFATSLRYYSGAEIRGMHQKYLELFRRLKAASPATRYYVVGYPQFLSLNSVSPVETCALNVGLDAYERLFMIASVHYLNQIIKSAAVQSGVTYLDIEGSLQGKALCDDNIIGDKAVNGIDNGNDIYGVIGNESFHPTDIGHKMMYDAMLAQMGGVSVIDFDACAGTGTSLCYQQPDMSVPPIPSYFSDGSASESQSLETHATQFIVDTSMSVANGVSKTAGMIVDTTKSVAYSVGDWFSNLSTPQVFAPSSNVSMTIYSDPQNLGTYQTDTNGNLITSVALPQSLPYGQHTVVLNGISPQGNERVIYQTIYVYANENDFDGNGVPNSAEKCTGVQPSGIDTDRDGVDDACDGIIEQIHDTTPPVVTAHVDVQPNDKGWYARDVTIHWTANDDTDTTIAPPADTTADQEGEYMYTSPQVCDAAGNCATGSITIKLDKTAPVVTAEMGRPANDNGWYADDVTISWGATDNVALQLTPPAPSIVTTEGEHTYTSAQVCDDAGNCSTGSQSVKLDKTLPMMGELSWDKNPKKSTEVSHLTVPVTDAGSGIARVEYFIGDTDPGLGNGAMMHYDGTSARVDQTTDFATGVYKISVRAQDAAGNWSQMSSGYLVVYDPTPGVKVRGRRTIKIVPGYAVNLPWVTSPTNATFGFSVKYAADGTIAKQSDLQFSYKTGSNCHRPARAINCHVFELNASSIKWMTVGGQNNSVATFEVAAKLRQDNIIQTVSVVLRVTDGNRINRFTEDDFMISIYQPTSMVFGTPDMWAGPLPVKRGNINIIDFIYKTN